MGRKKADSTSKQTLQENLPLEGERYTIGLDGEKEISVPLSSMFKTVRTIILETGEDCMIGGVNHI